MRKQLAQLFFSGCDKIASYDKGEGSALECTPRMKSSAKITHALKGHVISIKLIMTLFGICAGIVALSCSKDPGFNPQQEFALKAQCRDVGDKFSKEWRGRYSGVQYNEEPEFAYNRQLNSCVYFDGYSDALSVAPEVVYVYDQFVIDVFTNRILAEYHTANGKATVDPRQPQMVASLEEFQKRKAGLLGYTSK